MNPQAKPSRMRSGVIKRGNTWSYVLRVADSSGGQKQKWISGFKTERKAKLARAKVLAEIDKGSFASPSRVTLGEYLEEWLKGRELDLKPKTLDGYRYLARSFIIPSLGRVTLQKLTPRRLTNFYQELAVSGGKSGNGLARTTANRIAVLMKEVLNDAVFIDQLLSANPAERATVPRKTHEVSKSQLWTAQELRSFLETAESHRLYALYWLAAYTGMRRGEIVALRWSDVDFEKKLIRVHRSVTLTDTGRVEGTAKSGKERFVAFDDQTKSVLQAHLLMQVSDMELTQDSWEGTDYVFCTEFSLPLYPTTLAHLFQKLIERHNTEHSKEKLERIRFHDLRHVHATLLLEAGVPVHVVAARLGHADPSITLRTYTHVLRSQETSAADTFASRIRWLEN